MIGAKEIGFFLTGRYGAAKHRGRVASPPSKLTNRAFVRHRQSNAVAVVSFRDPCVRQFNRATAVALIYFREAFLRQFGRATRSRGFAHARRAKVNGKCESQSNAVALV